MTSEIPAWAKALGRIPSGLYIITARHGEQTTGMLASWVQQCSFDPPHISIAIKQGRYLADWIKAGASFAVHLLGEEHKKLISHFGKGFEPGEPAFVGLDVEELSDAAPRLRQVLGRLDCALVTLVPAGDHDLCIARVIDGDLFDLDAKPLIHTRKNGLKY